ncbi:MAG TPA: polysaccharide biosynthesis/export family protein [Terrimesophilobacter sp.]|nr:polysaccharide biosynthesis/export family protein [Terrimesophilobacter sp.]
MNGLIRNARMHEVSMGARWASAAACIALLAVGLGGCASFPFFDGTNREISAPPPDPVALDRESYVIGPDDTIQVVVWKNEELSVTVPVRPDGRISVPLVDDVQAEGLTPEELKEVLTESLAEYVTAPDVTVIVLETNSHTVTVVGGCARSGQIPLTRQMRVLEAIAMMGGFNPWARRDRVKVIRKDETGVREFIFDFGAYSKGKAPDSNLLLRPGDTIVVPE